MYRRFLIVCSLVIVASLARADGDAPMRPMNNSEAAAFKDVQSTIKAALPQPGDGLHVSYTGFDKKEIADGTSPDRMSRMMFMAK